MKEDSKVRRKKLKLKTTTCWLFSKNETDRARIIRDDQGGTDQDERKAGEPVHSIPSDFSDEYEFLELIGRGNVCEIFKVKNHEMESEFALKTLRDDLKDNRAAIKQFSREIDAITRLTHPNIASIYGHGTTSGGHPFLIQKLYEGKNLEEILEEEGPMDAERVLYLADQICQAMSYAHSRAVLHRDLKPSNVLVSRENNEEIVRLIDFGMASVLQSARCAITDVTKTGEIFGSPNYMSPEQCLGDKVDERSDIYSFGCLLHEVIAGAPPFNGINPVQVIMRQLKEKPPLFEDSLEFKRTRDSEDLLESLQNIVQKCLNKDPNERYQTFDQISIELEAIRTGEDSTIDTESVLPRTRTRVLAATIDAMLIAILISTAVVMTSNTNQTSNISQLADLFRPEFVVLNPESWIVQIFIDIISFVSVSITLEPWQAVLIGPLYVIISCLFHASFESSKLRATPGKKICGLVVVDRDGKRITFIRAVLRFFMHFIVAQTTVVSLVISEFAANRKNVVLGTGIEEEKTPLMQRIFSQPLDLASGAFVVRERTADVFPIVIDRYFRVPGSSNIASIHRALLACKTLLYTCTAFLILFIINKVTFSIFQGLVGSIFLITGVYFLILKRKLEELVESRNNASHSSSTWTEDFRRQISDGQ